MAITTNQSSAIRQYRLTHSLDRRIVSEARGTWKWQDAYRVVNYRLATLSTGALTIESYRRGPKLSWPQLRRAGLDTLPTGSRHHAAVTRGDVLGYMRRAIESGAVTWPDATRYLRLACRLCPALRPALITPDGAKGGA